MNFFQSCVYVCFVEVYKILIIFFSQILSLGAGFDSLYFRLYAEGALGSVTFFEVDFPEVARRKAALISSNACLMEALPDWETASTQQTSRTFTV